MATIYRFIVEEKQRQDSEKPRADKGSAKKGKDLPLFGGSRGGVEHNRISRAINPILNKVTSIWLMLEYQITSMIGRSKLRSYSLLNGLFIIISIFVDWDELFVPSAVALFMNVIENSIISTIIFFIFTLVLVMFR